MHRLIMVLVVCLCWSGISSVFAGGFALPAQGTRATGFALAFGSLADDLTALYHNPAGLAEQKGTRTYLSVHTGKAQVDYKMEGTDKYYGLERDVFYYPFVGVSSDFGTEKLTGGIALYSPYGAIVDYPDEAPTKYIIQEIQLQTYFVTAGAGYKVSNKLSLGLGISYVYARAYMKQVYKLRTDYFQMDLPIELDVDDTSSFCGNLGVLYHATDKFTLGASYTSKTTGKLSGNVNVLLDSPLIPIDSLAVKELTVSLPDIYRLGARYSVTDRLMLLSEFYYWRWSVLKNFTIVLDIPEMYQQLFPSTLVFPRNFDDSYSYALATQYSLTKNSAVTAGAFYDTTPIPEETNDIAIPDSDKLGIALGYKYEKNSLKFDFTVANAFFEDRTVKESIQPFPTTGEYKYNFLFIIGDFTYTF